MIIFEKFSNIKVKDWLIIFQGIYEKIVDKIEYYLYKFFM